MVTHYSVHIEFERRTITGTESVRAVDELAEWHAAVGTSPRGYVDVQMSVPAETLEGAIRAAAAVTSPVLKSTAIAITAMTETEFDARQGFVTMPELIGATETAELLGVSRQRVLQLVDEGKLGGTKVGKSLVLAREAVEAYRSRTSTSL